MKTLDKFEQIYWNPFLTGVFMWVNAIKDSALFVDWPDCIFYKADMLYKTHDIASKLKDSSIDTKLYFSWVMPNQMIRGYDDKIKRKLEFIEENKKFNLWIITCMPVTWLLANQYNHIYNDLKKDYIFVPSYTDKYRIDWYSVLLRELAKFIKIDKTKIKKKLNISIIWYLFDRNEWDCLWNIDEIKRILGLLWITINSIWLDWGNYNDLYEVENSELLVSLPYWKFASEILSKKLWVKYIELEVPFWLKNTIDFVYEIWNKLWIDKKNIDLVLQNEVKIVKEKIDLLDSKRFLDKNYLFAGDPFLEVAIKDIGDFLWMNHIKTYNYYWSKQFNKNDLDISKIDLIIWNSEFYIDWYKNTKVEFWFPSYNTHFLWNRPYMWFRWLLYFIERLYNELSSKTYLNKNNIL
jgi:hypothetical protein